MPRLKACGPRDEAFGDFKIALSSKGAHDYVAMWIDSEDPLKNVELTWAHINQRDGWTRPAGAQDGQVLFMTTSMETWIVADGAALEKHYGDKLQVSALPPLTDLEARSRQDIHKQLEHATRNCANAYAKGEPLFKILGELSPATSEQHLPSFARMRRILNQCLELGGWRR